VSVELAVIDGGRVEAGRAGGSRDAGVMSAERDELRELVEQLPEEDVPAALADVRRHVRPAGERRWPPAFFGAGRAERSEVAARTEEILREGFGRPA
jgi:hypothetical protein